MIGFYYRNEIYEKLVVPYLFCVQPSKKGCLVDITSSTIAEEVLDIRNNNSRLVEGIKKEEIICVDIPDNIVRYFNIDVHMKDYEAVARKGAILFGLIRKKWQ